jgi:hypothetical protein
MADTDTKPELSVNYPFDDEDSDFRKKDIESEEDDGYISEDDNDHHNDYDVCKNACIIL